MKQLLATFLIGAGLVSAAGAATISSVASSSLPGPSTGTIGPIGATPAPNNDNATAASPNAVPASIFFNALGTAEYEFVVAGSGGTTEYSFSQAAVNNTGQAWSGFRFELGYGTGAGFTSAAGLGGVAFDVPTRDPAPVSSRFTVLDHQSESLHWTGATVPSIGSVAFSFAVDVPDGLASVNPAALDRFTLRATPEVMVPVPEPTTWLLMTGGLAALAWRSRRRG